MPACHIFVLFFKLFRWEWKNLWVWGGVFWLFCNWLSLFFRLLHVLWGDYWFVFFQARLRNLVKIILFLILWNFVRKWSLVFLWSIKILLLNFLWVFWYLIFLILWRQFILNLKLLFPWKRILTFFFILLNFCNHFFSILY